MEEKLYKLNEMIPLNPYPYHLVLTDNIKDYKKACKSNKISGYIPKNSGGCTIYSENYNTFIILMQVKDLFMLSHEMNHVMFDLYETIGQEANSQSSETFCYMQQHYLEIASNIYEYKVAYD